MRRSRLIAPSGYCAGVELCYYWRSSSSTELFLEPSLQCVSISISLSLSHTHTHTHTDTEHNTQLLTLLGAPSGMGRRKVGKDSRVEKKRVREVSKGEKRESLTSVLIITTVPQSAKVRLNLDGSSLIKIQTHYCA